jgi:Zn-dependent protease/predicted transcriptional regulator
VLRRADRAQEASVFDIPSFRIGKLFGIPLEVNLSWIVIFLLVTVMLATSYYPTVTGAQGAPAWLLGVLGAITALLFFASIVAHELCHSVVTRIEGGSVDKITLFIFGGVSQIQEEPKSPSKELLMAAAGPGMSLLLAGLFYLASVYANASAPWWVTAPLQYLAGINLLVGLFNLLPGFPLDGGRVLRAILWGITGNLLKATKWAARSGQTIGWLLVALGVVSVLSGESGGGIWLGLVGWFIAWLAGSSYQQMELQTRLSGLTVDRVMTPHPAYVDGSITVDTLVQEHMLGRQHSRYPVFYDGAIIGVVALDHVKSVDRNDWPYVKVADITDKDLGVLSVDSTTPVLQLLPRLAAEKTGALLVVHEGRLVGILTRADVIDVLNRQPIAS